MLHIDLKIQHFRELLRIIYWSTGKDLDTVQVLASVWNDTDLQGDHLRMLKSWDLHGVKEEKIVKN